MHRISSFTYTQSMTVPYPLLILERTAEGTWSLGGYSFPAQVPHWAHRLLAAVRQGVQSAAAPTPSGEPSGVETQLGTQLLPPILYGSRTQFHAASRALGQGHLDRNS